MLCQLPDNMPPRIVVVRRRAGNVHSQLADRLDSLARLHVKEAEQGDVLEPRAVPLCPWALSCAAVPSGNTLTLRLSDAPEVNRHGHQSMCCSARPPDAWATTIGGGPDRSGPRWRASASPNNTAPIIWPRTKPSCVIWHAQRSYCLGWCARSITAEPDCGALDLAM